MKRTGLFIVACLLSGLGGALGSMVGHAFGGKGLWVGGVLGGLAASLLVGWIGVRARWIARSQLRPTVIGTAIGFLAACLVAVKTLSSPIGPIAATLLVGVGALLGSSTGSSSTALRGDED